MLLINSLKSLKVAFLGLEAVAPGHVTLSLSPALDISVDS